jgi:hypothetical protein
MISESVCISLTTESSTITSPTNTDQFLSADVGPKHPLTGAFLTPVNQELYWIYSATATKNSEYHNSSRHELDIWVIPGTLRILMAVHGKHYSQQTMSFRVHESLKLAKFVLWCYLLLPRELGPIVVGRPN